MRHLLLLLVACTLSTSSLLSQGIFSGTYTIGGSSPSYASITEAANAISLGLVNGPVTFNIRPGVYNEFPVIQAMTGASATNRVVFQSETLNPADVIITASRGGDQSNHWVVRFDAALYASLKYVTVRNTYIGNTSTCINLTNLSNYIEISNCKIEIDSSATTTQVFGIASTKSNSIGTTGDFANFCKIINNEIVGGYSGVRFSGKQGTQPSEGHEITGNIIRKVWRYGVEVSAINNLLVSYNNVNMRYGNATGMGILVGSLDRGDVKIIANTVNCDVFGINLSVIKSSTRSLVANNMIYCAGVLNAAAAGLRFAGSTDVDILNNSVNFDGPYSDGGALSFSNFTIPCSGMVVKNNILVCNNAAFVIHSKIGAIQSSSNNVYYTKRSKRFNLEAEVATLEEWATLIGGDAGSFESDPIFVSKTDLHTANPLLNGKSTVSALVPLDFDKETRSVSMPDIGADETNLTFHDLAIIDLQPKALVQGANSVSLTFRNQGYFSLNDSMVQVTYSIDGGATWSTPEIITLSGLGAVYSSKEYTLSNTFNYAADTSFSLCAKFEEISLLKDTILRNNIFCQTACPGFPGGTFTIGTKNANFLTIQLAVDSINNALQNNYCSLGGPIVFSIQPGTYIETFSLLDLAGSSPSLDITFTSSTGKAEDVIITNEPKSAGIFWPTITLYQAKHYRFKNLTIQNTLNDSAGIFHFRNTAEDIIIQDCILLADSSSQTGKVYPIVFSGNTIDKNGLLFTNNTIQNNYISGGLNNVLFKGSNLIKSKGNNFDGNHFAGSFLAAFYLIKSNEFVIQNNRITARFDNIFNVGILMDSTYSNSVIQKNNFFELGKHGIFMQNCAADSILIANNMFSGGFRNNSGSAIYLIDVQGVKTIFNSAIYDAPSEMASSIYMCVSGQNNSIINNNFVNKIGGLTIKVNDPTAIDQSSHNNLFTTGGILAYWGQNIATTTELETVSGKNSNSFNVNPVFDGEKDLHTNQAELDGSGKFIASIMVDFDNHTRNNPPDIGADESFFNLDLELQAIVLPTPSSNLFVDTTYTVQARVKNIGDEPIPSFTLTYSLDGVQKDDFSSLIPLTVGEERLISFITPWIPKTEKIVNLCINATVAQDVNLINNSKCGGYIVEKKMVNPPVGVDTKSDEPTLTLYPNPSTGLISVNIENHPSNVLNVVIYNLLGQEINNQRLEVTLGSSIMNLQHLKEGVYILNIEHVKPLFFTIEK